MKITLTLALTLAAGSAFAQQPSTPSTAAQVADARFAAWIGCWRLDDDLAGTGARMCITPEKAGVRMQTVVGTQRGIDEIVIADAVAHPIADSECTGTERAEWSSDGARVFRTTTVTCGKEAARTIKSIAFLAPGPSWINVQHVSGSAVSTAVRVQRYRRAANQTLADGSKAPQPDAGLTMRTTRETTKWSIEDVIEASGKAPAEAVQAALTEANHGFDLNKRTLLALDAGGVDEQVIDLMVALTYPKRFVVERRGGDSSPSGILTGSGWLDPLMSPMMLGAYADCFSPFGYGYRSYYSACNMGGYAPMGYGYYGYNRFYGGNGYYGYGGYGGWVDVGGLPPQVGGAPIEPQGDGRAVNGRGYTQVRSRDSEGSPRINSGGNGSAAGWSSGGNATSGGYSSGSSSSGSSGGSSSGGDSGARVAVPKGGGE
jgi:hypothetical protein